VGRPHEVNRDDWRQEAPTDEAAEEALQEVIEDILRKIGKASLKEKDELKKVSGIGRAKETNRWHSALLSWAKKAAPRPKHRR